MESQQTREESVFYPFVYTKEKEKRKPIAKSNSVLFSFLSPLFIIIKKFLSTTSSLSFFLSLLIFLSDVLDKIAYTTRVTPFVIVPGDELDKVGVQLDSSTRIKDGRSSVAYEIGGNDAVLSVLEDALVFAFRCLLDDVLDFLVCGTFLNANHEIDDGNIKSGNTECETTV